MSVEVNNGHLVEVGDDYYDKSLPLDLVELNKRLPNQDRESIDTNDELELYFREAVSYRLLEAEEELGLAKMVSRSREVELSRLFVRPGDTLELLTRRETSKGRLGEIEIFDSANGNSVPNRNSALVKFKSENFESSDKFQLSTVESFLIIGELADEIGPIGVTDLKADWMVKQANEGKFDTTNESHTQEEERIFEDGQLAKNVLIQSNTRWVIALAKKKRGRGVTFEDLIQEGNLGLIRAADRYDYRRGYRFATYATSWINQSIDLAIANHSRTIRLPTHLHDTLKRIKRVSIDLVQENGCESQIDEIAQKVGIDPGKVDKILRSSKTPISLHQPNGDGSNEELGDFIEDITTATPEEEVGSKELKKELKKVMDTCLDERTAHVIKLHYGLTDGQSRNFQEIGYMFGLSGERIRQIEEVGLERLKPILKELADYLDS